MLICNGSPKTGTHLLLKTLYLFGGDCKLAIHNHVQYAHRKENVTHINIFRSPRNVIGSWLKFTGQELTEVNFIKAIPTLVKEMFDYVEWYTKPPENCLNVKFEELLTLPKITIDIGKFLNKTPVKDHFKKIWGGTPTFSGKLFIWRDHWTSDIDTTWVNSGGLILENDLQYDPDQVWIRKK
jgi:hypothetical protein